MQTLRDELLGTVNRHIRHASSDELTRILSAMIVAEQPALLAYPSGGIPSRGDELIHDGSIVLDHRAGLMWTAGNVTHDSSSKEKMTWSEANEACAELRLAGYDDWRMPTVDELFGRADRTRSNPAIDTNYFPSCESSLYWTSTPYAPSPGDCAWYVNFYYGLAYWSNRGYGGFVRAVRASQ